MILSCYKATESILVKLDQQTTSYHVPKPACISPSRETPQSRAVLIVLWLLFACVHQDTLIFPEPFSALS